MLGFTDLGARLKNSNSPCFNSAPQLEKAKWDNIKINYRQIDSIELDPNPRPKQSGRRNKDAKKKIINLSGRGRWSNVTGKAYSAQALPFEELGTQR